MALRRVALALAALPAVLAGVTEQNAPPPGWVPTGKLTPSDSITLTLVLSMQNIDSLESQLLSVATPGSPQYGHYLDNSGVKAAFAPSSESVNAVTNWLKSAGVHNYVVDGFFVDFAADVSTVNSLLSASYEHYSHNGVGKVRTQSYTIPDEVSNDIQLVDPGNFFGSSQAFVPTPSHTEKQVARAADSPPPSKVSVAASCQTSITPACLKQLYSVDSYTPDPNSGSSIGFGSFLNQSALYSDLFDYEQANGIPHQNFSTVLIAGATNDQDPSTAQIGEADLDVQNIVGIAHPLPVVEFITGGSPPFVPNIDQPTAADNENEPYVPYYRYLLSQPNSALPLVISNSYGDEEDSVPLSYAVTACTLIAFMGLRGITILESSGDLGVGAGCLAPDNKTVEFNAIFPATCPYLTSVGGTVAVTPEIAWEGSSGGFSKYFSRPAYQDAALAAYFTTVSPATFAYYGQYTDFNGRGFPDVSAHSVTPDYQVVYAGKLSPSGGTSAASPVWAAIVGLLNDARLRAGQPALGWLNPALYLAGGAAALNDITGGFSIGCNGNNTQSGGAEPPGSGVVPGARWNATVGWDPVTGFGTPNFEKLKSFVLSPGR